MGVTRALVLHPEIRGQVASRAAGPALDEAVALTAALSLEVVGSDVVRLPRVHPGTLFGSGKMDELKAMIEAEEVDLVIIDGVLSPVQQRNIEKAWGCKVLDRTGLILEIFGARAATREGVLQVELAALTYARSRLVRAWTHLERQRGGLGFVGGAGETQIEADRRAIDDAIVRLKRQLEKVIKTRTLHRASRAKIPYPIVALVGYTNAGKSTLFNRVTGAEVMAEDMLFATLDPTMRAITLPSGTPVILSDTVGFISALPTQLVAAFRATLEEVLDADLILHVRDISHPETAAQSEDVMQILEDLGALKEGAQPFIEVWNKLDQLTPEARRARLARAAEGEGVPISALTGEGVPALLASIDAALAPPTERAVLKLGHGDGKRRAWLYDNAAVVEEEVGEEGTTLTLDWTQKAKARYAQM